MKKIIRLHWIILLLLIGTGKSSAAGKRQASGKNVDGTWQIVELQGNEVKASENFPYINLDYLKKSMNGFAGCNRIHGNFRIKPGKRHLQFGPVASTRMICPLMDMESTVLGLLPKTASYQMRTEGKQNDMLVLQASDGSVLMRLARMMPLDGKWVVSKVYDMEISDQENEIFLIFNSSQNIVYGTLGCNSYHASLQYTPQKKSLIKFGTGLTTLRMCDKMEIESQLMKAFEEVVSYKKFSDRKAILCDTGGKVLIELTR